MIDDEICALWVSFLRSLRFFAASPDLSFLCDFAALREILLVLSADAAQSDFFYPL